MDLLPSDGESANPTAWSWRTIPDALDSTRPIYDVKYENGTDSQDSDVVMSAKKVVEHEEESPPEVANTDETIDYMNFLQELQIWSVDNCCPGKILVKSSDKPLSSGVKMDAYSALLKYEDQNGKKMEAHQPNTYLKCYKIKTTQKSEENNRSHTVRELNTQLKDTIEDIRAMRNNANGHSTPRILIYWEEVDSAAEFPIYRPILCVGEDVVMGNLEDYVRDCKLNKSSDFCPNDLIKEIHSAFDFLHTGGLVHGNLKPSSILVRKARSIRGDTDLPMLIDIGFGYESWKSDVVEKTPPLEITPYWCAPEIFEDDASPVSYTRDYYSFALIVWFILFGYPVGDLKKGISEADCDMFRKIKRDSRIPNPDESGTPITGLSVNYELGNLLESTEDLTDRVPDLQDMLFEAFNARWKWELAEQTEMKRLEDEESIERRGEIMKDLMDQGKIRELEWDPELSKWIPVKDIMHHNYRAIMESGLQRDPKARVCLIQKETPTVFSEEFSYQLASFYITGSRDASTAVFPTGEKVIEKFENVMQEIQRQIEESKLEILESKKFTPLQSVQMDHLPEPLRKYLGQQAITAAINKEQNKEANQRLLNIRNVCALGKWLPESVDYIYWAEKEACFGSGIQRLDFILRKGMFGTVSTASARPMDKTRELEWTLDGLTELPGGKVFEKLRKLLKEVDTELLRVPLSCAVWDYATEYPVNEFMTVYPDNKEIPPAFLAIYMDDLGRLHEILSEKIEPSPKSLIWEDFNLLNFAINFGNAQIMSYLICEHGFQLKNDDLDERFAMAQVMSDPHAILLREIDSILRRMPTPTMVPTADEGSDSSSSFPCPVQPLIDIFKIDQLDYVVVNGSMKVMHCLDAIWNDQTFPLPKIVHEMWVSCPRQKREMEASNPLFLAITARRLQPFLRLLDWRTPAGPAFSAHAVNHRGLPLLSHAVQCMAPLFVAALLMHGADPNKICQGAGGERWNPLALACMSRNESYIDTLEQRRINHVRHDYGKHIIKRDTEAIISAARTANAQRMLIVELLLRHGANINPCGPGLPPLSQSMIFGNVPLTHFLLRHGASPNKITCDHPHHIHIPCPLGVAIEEGLDDVVHALLAAGANPNGLLATDPGISHIKTVTERGKAAVFSALLAHGLDLSAITPLMGGISVLSVVLIHLTILHPENIRGFVVRSNLSEKQLVAAWCEMRTMLATHLSQLSPPELRRIINAGGLPRALHLVARLDSREDALLRRLVVQNTDDLAVRDMFNANALDEALVYRNHVFVQLLAEELGLRGEAASEMGIEEQGEEEGEGDDDGGYGHGNGLTGPRTAREQLSGADSGSEEEDDDDHDYGFEHIRNLRTARGYELGGPEVSPGGASRNAEGEIEVEEALGRDTNTGSIHERRT